MLYLHAGVQRAPFKEITQHRAMCALFPENLLCSSACLPLLQCQAENLENDEEAEDFSVDDDQGSGE
jgi:hypothetical protein